MTTSAPALHHMVCNAGPQAFRQAWWQWGQPDAAHVVVCVHGLTRQGRDFDALAQTLLADAAARGLPPLRIICPDIAGRGQSEWLRDHTLYQVPVYVGAMLQLLAHLQQQAPITRLDWVGTSMGGQIGLGMTAAQAMPVWPQGVPHFSRMVLNDVGPTLSWQALSRIGSYVGDTGHFASEAEAVAHLRERFAAFGPHSDEEWTQLNQAQLMPHPQGGWRQHYDPAIGRAFGDISQDAWAQGEAMLWQMYDAIQAPLLLLRGADSDLLPHETAQAMRQRGPRAQLVEFAGVGHAPTIVAQDQRDAVTGFLLNPLPEPEAQAA